MDAVLPGGRKGVGLQSFTVLGDVDQADLNMCHQYICLVLHIALHLPQQYYCVSELRVYQRFLVDGALKHSAGHTTLVSFMRIRMTARLLWRRGVRLSLTVRDGGSESLPEGSCVCLPPASY